MSSIRRIVFLLLCLTCHMLFAQTAEPSTEMRAVWIATVDNIDFPDSPTSDSKVLQDNFIRLLDVHHNNGINTVIVQVRPASDAFYASPFEPWSQWLTGTQGLAPAPFYDPLRFMITETHNRGMEFHAWINPYRAVNNITTCSLSDCHVMTAHPEWLIRYGDKYFYDPGNKEAQEYLTDVVRDMVSRYEVDAVHIDDYFYPYPVPNLKFNDDKTYGLYGKGMKRDDWRRSNTDSIVCKLYRTIKQTRAGCQFGVSPFGVWRNSDRDPRGSRTQAGPTNYDFLYADILLWLKNGWVDYVTPQLYWEMSSKHVPFDVVLDWWSKNTFGVNCYIGLGAYRAGSNKAWSDRNLLPRQIQKVRNTPNIKGLMFYSSNSLEKNLNGWGDSLRLNYFRLPASAPKIK